MCGIILIKLFHICMCVTYVNVSHIYISYICIYEAYKILGFHRISVTADNGDCLCNRLNCIYNNTALQAPLCERVKI